MVPRLIKKSIACSLFFISALAGRAQEEEPDSTGVLEEVTVRAFEQNRRRELSAMAVRIIETNNADRYTKTSLLHGFNSVAGVRMEERSPGSYRLNIRGSSLRSPFGVRNVKVYWNDIPVTDAGGNTYFNQFAYNNFSSIDIFKGPAGSLYGAGTGGLLLIRNFTNAWKPGVSLEYISGSYQLHNIFGSVRFGSKENRNQLSYAHNQSDGYRVQTRMRRDNLSWITQLKNKEQHQLSASVLFTDMYYQTPGALTRNEFTADPRAARPAAGGFPSAVEAKAAIHQKNFLAGFTNIFRLHTELTSTTTLFGTFNQVKNPAIRNYERRNEPGLGGRTFFTYQRKLHRGEDREKAGSFQLIAGGELQLGFFNTQVFKNSNGGPDTLRTNDDITYTNYSFFTQGDLLVPGKWILNAGVSINHTKVVFSRLSNFPIQQQSRSYRGELAPMLTIKKIIGDRHSLKASLSRGFSPPTIAELLPSTGTISTALEAEYGWNYEVTAALSLLRNRLQLEATGFYFTLRDALVQRRDLSGADFFVNAGKIRQKGIELHADYLFTTTSGFIDFMKTRAGYTLSHFRYGSFIKGPDDFSGKTVPSVPAHTLSVLLDLHLENAVYLNLTYYYASEIFLNDANTARAEAYHLAGVRAGWRRTFKKKYRLEVYAGADNLLDQRYSLGHDINAPAGRYYNAAPRRNIYAGIAWQWLKAPVK